MSSLRPEIKRLMELGSHRAAQGDDLAPAGFAARVVARASIRAQATVDSFSNAFSMVSWAAAILLLVCSVLLWTDERTPEPASKIAGATFFMAKSLAP